MGDDTIRGAFEPFGQPYDSHIPTDEREAIDRQLFAAEQAIWKRDEQIARLERTRNEANAAVERLMESLAREGLEHAATRDALRDLDARLARVAQAMGENAPAIARLILVDAALDGWEPAR